ncbi:MAG: DNA adenine methylase, partial [Verrucomicrobiae bacterium]|nr:DNA adenine methylase [Verrucomicrobiae bacterium]
DAPTKAYGAWTQGEMVQFRARVDRLQGRWLVTINDSSANRQLFDGCRIRPVSTANRLRNNRTTSPARFGELIITRD